jgi:hypothetical protein
MNRLNTNNITTSKKNCYGLPVFRLTNESVDSRSAKPGPEIVPLRDGQVRPYSNESRLEQFQRILCQGYASSSIEPFMNL